MEEYSLYNFILKDYLGEDLVLNKKYRSPIPGRQDSTPSFCVKESNGRLIWRDWGFADATGNKVENLIMCLHDPPLSYSEAMTVIEGSNFPPIKVKSQKVSEYKIKYGALDYSEALWWDDYHVTPKTLRKYRVFGVRQLWKDKSLIYNYEKGQLMFVYVGETKEYWQTYMPKRSGKKWMLRNNSFILGFEQTPLTGEILFIVSGMKDGLCLYEATGYPFISGCGESDTPNIKKILPELKLRFRKIRTILDPDTPGREATDKFLLDLKIPPADWNYPNKTDDLAKLSQKRGIKFLRDNLRI